MNQHLGLFIYLSEMMDDAKKVAAITCIIIAIVCVPVVALTFIALAEGVREVHADGLMWAKRLIAALGMSIVVYILLPQQSAMDTMIVTTMAHEINALDGACPDESSQVHLQTAMADYMQAWIDAKTKSLGKK